MVKRGKYFDKLNNKKFEKFPLHLNKTLSCRTGETSICIPIVEINKYFYGFDTSVIYKKKKK